MRITFLGTGTSQGIPVIGCDCATCLSEDHRDQRLRVSIWIELDGQHYIIDTGPDFRQQMLRAGLSRVDAVLMTHEHRDHVAGLDDIRPFNFKYEMDMPVYATKRVQEALKASFEYIFEATYPGVPRVILKEVAKNQAFRLGNYSIQPVQYWHGAMPVMGYRFGDFAYLTDFKTIDKDQLQYLKNLDTLVISALHHDPHYSHMSLTEALEMIEIIAPKQAYLTHLSHQMGPVASIENQLPANVQVAYDGLSLTLKDPEKIEKA
jgi:phosphoribosyl 1,2-cyclic phosphate phosphodiesterase